MRIPPKWAAGVQSRTSEVGSLDLNKGWRAKEPEQQETWTSRQPGVRGAPRLDSYNSNNVVGE